MLPDLPHFLLFMTATIILNITPGSDVMFIGGQTLLRTRNGIYAVLGTSTGLIFWIALTVVGLTEILNNSILALNTIKYIGAAYLLYLAYIAFFTKTITQPSITKPKNNQYLAYIRGIFANLLNPKVGIFFLTFLPEFIDPQRGFIWLQLLSLGICFIVSGTLVNFVYVYLFAHLKDRMYNNARTKKILNQITGVVFCILALMVILT